MSNKNKKTNNSGVNPMARILCLVLVGLMVLSGAVLAIVSSCMG